MTQMLEQSDEDFQVTMISMGQDIVENVDDRHEQMGISAEK